MKTISREEILDKIKELPEKFLEQLSNYVDFLMYKEAKKLDS